MPSLVKIGFTSGDDASDRIASLYATGVPVPFKLEYACKVKEGFDAPTIEKALHIAFGPHRINPKREFFRIEPDQAIAILKLFQEEETTTEVNRHTPSQTDPESLAAGEQLRKRRPNMNFVEMGVPIGSLLNFTESDATVTVTGPRKVKLGEEEMSISAATQAIAGEDVYTPALYWRFNGKLLRDLYNETYEEIS
jgi:hypothetical protein